MKKGTLLMLIIAATFILTACEPTIDASSDKALKASAEKVVAKLNAEQKAYYSEAIDYFVDLDYEQMGGSAYGDQLEQARQQKKLLEMLGAKIDGMTGQEVIDLYLSELKALEITLQKKIEDFTPQLDTLGTINIEDTSLYTTDDFMKTPSFSFKGVNGNKTPLSSVTFYLCITDNETGSVVKDDIVNFNFSSPIAPGASADYSVKLGFVQWKPFFETADKSKISYNSYLIKAVASDGTVIADATEYPATDNRLKFIRRRI